MFLESKNTTGGGTEKGPEKPNVIEEADETYFGGDYGGDFIGFSESGRSNAENARRRIAEKQARASQEGLVTKQGISKWRGVIAKLGINLPRFSLKGIIGSIKNNFRL